MIFESDEIYINRDNVLPGYMIKKGRQIILIVNINPSHPIPYEEKKVT